MCASVHAQACLRYSTHNTLLFGLVYDVQPSMRGNTLDETIKLLCAAVRGIIQRKDQFVLKLLAKDEQVSRLVELEDIAKDKCAVKRTKRKIQSAGLGSVAVTVLELQPHCEYL